MAAVKKMDTASMDREALLAELGRLQAEIAAAPAAGPLVVAAAPEKDLGMDDIAPPWTIPLEMHGRELLRDGISAYCPDRPGHMREFIPGQVVTGVTMAVKQNVLAIISAAANQYKENMINRGAIMQNAPMEFDA